MDQSSGNEPDLSGNNYTFTAFGAPPSVANQNPFKLIPSGGSTDSCRNIQSTSYYFESTDSGLLTALKAMTEFTLVAWLYPTRDAVTSYETGTLLKLWTAGQLSFYVGVQKNNSNQYWYPQCAIRTDSGYTRCGGNRAFQPSYPLLQANAGWYRLVARWDGSDLSLWLNAAEVESRSASGNLIQTGTQLTHGYADSNDQLDQPTMTYVDTPGYVSDCYIYDVAQSDSWIILQYQSSLEDQALLIGGSTHAGGSDGDDAILRAEPNSGVFSEVIAEDPGAISGGIVSIDGRDNFEVAVSGWFQSLNYTSYSTSLILYNLGNGWVKETATLPTTPDGVHFTDVWVQQDGVAWIAAAEGPSASPPNGGRLYQYTPGNTPIEVFTWWAQITSVSGSGPSDIWISCGQRGTGGGRVYHFDGATWNEIVLPGGPYGNGGESRVFTYSSTLTYINHFSGGSNCLGVWDGNSVTWHYALSVNAGPMCVSGTPDYALLGGYYNGARRMVRWTLAGGFTNPFDGEIQSISISEDETTVTAIQGLVDANRSGFRLSLDGGSTWDSQYNYTTPDVLYFGWGSHFSIPFTERTVRGSIDQVKIIAEDVLRVTFGISIAIDEALRDISNWEVLVIPSGDDPQVVDVRIDPTADTVTSVDLEVTKTTKGVTYQVNAHNLSDDDGVSVVNADGEHTLSARFSSHLTKVDSILNQLPGPFSSTLDSNIRQILSAIAIEDDVIGGKDSEISLDIRIDEDASGSTLGTMTLGTDTYGG